MMETFRGLLCELGAHVRDAVIDGRAGRTAGDLCAVAAESASDTIYEIDRLSEAAIGAWFSERWPASEPVELVMEGVDDENPLRFPAGTAAGDTKWKCILDPIDGTRGLMHDKRSAWVLAGIAPDLGPHTMLSDIAVAAMTEIPTTKQWRADQASAVRGGGVVATQNDVRSGESALLELRASTARDFHHGFASIAKFFPEGRTLTAQIEERIWDELIGLGKHASPTVFDDQYISTGGQFFELLSGRDRFVADLRPLVLDRLGFDGLLACHPYDVAAALVLTEAGVVYESPLGGFPDAPLDTTSPVAWAAYANPALAEILRPVLGRVLSEMLA